jgi:esterase/lipase
MNTYEQSIYKFRSIKNKLIQKGVIESDLPFLFEKKEHDIAILMLHGSESTPCNTYNLGHILYEKGFNTLGVLLDGHGYDVQRLHNGQISWKDCYRSAVECLDILLNMNKKVYVLGSSFGGCLAYILGIEFHNKISGVIAVSAPTFSKHEVNSNFKWVNQVVHSIKAVEHNIHKLDIPTLILHSSDDKTVKFNQAFFAYEKIITSQKKLVLYDGVGHSLGFGSNTYEVANDIENFIKSYTELVSIRFELEINANTVSVAGEFNNWDSKKNPMFFDENKWILDLMLPLGREYQYKFVINGNNWILDPNAEKAYTPLGSLNSFIKIQ